MVATRIDAFQQAYRNLQLQPLVKPEEIAHFRVAYGDEWLDDLEQMVLDCSDYNNQLIFAGHRGCGKSTLLAEFAQRLDDRYFTVFFSISDLIEMPDINHINILFAIAVQLMAKAENEEIEIDPAKKDAFFNWFKERTQVNEFKLTGEAETGLDLFKLLKFKLKADRTMREEIKQKFTRNSRDLIDTLNLMAAEVELACNKKIVVIIDDLDKLELDDVEKIFKQNLNALLQPNFTVVYTIPIATIRDGVLKKHIEDAVSNRIFVMPVLKLYAKGESHQPGAQVFPETMDKLCEILRKRVSDDLFTEEIGLEIAKFSGGVMRELIRISQECCRLMLVRLRKKARNQESIEDQQIDSEILNRALDILRNDMTITLSKSDREILQQTYNNYRPDDPKQQEFLDLLHNTYAIEYRNTESWYDLHPLVIRQLQQEGMIS
jgi:energy-coupling factor transporter ATP-binding protein EcfA2